MGIRKQNPFLAVILTTTICGFGFHLFENHGVDQDITRTTLHNIPGLKADEIFFDRKNPNKVAFNFPEQDFYATVKLESPNRYFMDVHPSKFSGFDKTDKIVKRYAINPNYKVSFINSFLKKKVEKTKKDALLKVLRP